jgi:hypothetical protein
VAFHVANVKASVRDKIKCSPVYSCLGHDRIYLSLPILLGSLVEGGGQELSVLGTTAAGQQECKARGRADDDELYELDWQI